ncbi:hypothetical protein [Pacificibacter marinus]|nr:hypothetical protein [Pacificibacter marinus]MBU2867571.1 hypothetical protein [Pacificibacter marinus]
MIKIENLYRYPIKGFPAEPLIGSSGEDTQSTLICSSIPSEAFVLDI